MPIRINHLDKNRSLMQLADITVVTIDPIFVSQASYTDPETVSGLLYGSD